MATYDYMTSLKNSGRKVQVESAKRDGDGKNIANNYAKQVGYYEGMGVGTADNLTPYSENSGIAQHSPFIFQSTAGGSDVGALCQLKSLRGQSYVLNQNVPAFTSNSYLDVTATASNDGETLTLSGTASGYWYYTLLFNKEIAAGHKILFRIILTNPNSAGIFLRLRNQDQNDMAYYGSDFSTRIITLSEMVDRVEFACNSNEVLTGIVLEKAQFIDLTQMFGAGNEPTTVEEFNHLFPLPYYEYNTGELVSCQASSLVTVGYNQFDGVLEQGGIDADGTSNNSSLGVKGKNYIRVIPGQKYTLEVTNDGGNTIGTYFVCEYDGNKNFIQRIAKYSNDSKFELSNNCQYVKIFFYCSSESTITGVQIAFHLTWDESKTGYETYSKHEYGLPNEVLRSAGSVYDEIKSDGTKITRIGFVDLGTLNWSYVSANTRFYSVGIKSLVNPTSTTSETPNILCNKYQTNRSYDIYDESKDLVISIDNEGNILIRDTNYTDGDTLKAALNGVYLFYELATPVESESIAFQENITIDDWGTMEFVSTYPQGNDFFYYVDYKAFVDSLGNREDIEFDASEIVSHSELTSAMSSIDLSEYPKKAGNETITGKWSFDDSTGIKFGGGTVDYYIANISNNLVFNSYNTNNPIVSIRGWNMNLHQSLRMYTDNNVEIGSSSNRVKNLYLAGKISDGTKEFNADNVVRFFDAPASGTPDGLVDALSNGNICYVNGNSSNSSIQFKYGSMWFPTKGTTGEAWGIGYYFKQANHEKVCLFQYRGAGIASYNWISLANIGWINGKEIPAYPSNTGTFVLKCVNGVLTWVQES